MIIHYCEKCGHRIAPADVESGAARVSEEGKGICAACVPARRGSAKVPAPPTAPAPRESHQDIKPLRRDSSRTGLPLAAPTTAAPAADAPVPGARPTAPQNRKPLLIGAAAVLLLLLVALALVLGRSRDQTPPKTAGDEADRTALLPPVLSPDVPKTVPVVTKEEPTKDPDGYDPRATFAQSLLEQAKAAFKKAPDDPWTYREKLQALVRDHGSTAAGKEAATILTTLSSAPKPGEPGLPSEESWKTALNLLERADPASQTVAGKWILENETLRSTRDGTAKLALPYLAPDEYDLKLVLTRLEGNDLIGVNLTHLGTPLTFHLASWMNRVAGWESLKGERVINIPTSFRRNNMLENNKRYTLVIQMRKDRWVAFLNGQLLVKRDGNMNIPMSQFKELMFPNPKQMGLLTFSSAYRIDEFKVLEVTGKGRVLSGVEATVVPETNVPVVAQPPKIVEKPAQKSVEQPIVVDTKSAAYAIWLKAFHRHWANRNWAAAKSCVAEALENPDLASKRSQLTVDRECLTLAELAEDATAKGAAALVDGREFILEDGKKKETYEIGRRAKVLKADASNITIEQDIGGGKITLNLPLSNLTPETRFALVRIGVPDDGKGKLALAFHRFADCLKARTERTDKLFINLLEQARKAQAPAAPLNQVQEWFKVMDREKQAAEALTGVERVVVGRNLAESQAALAKCLKGFADAAFLSENADRIAEVERRIEQLKLQPGLLAKYYSGGADGKQTFHFTRPITSLEQDWGNGPPAEGVPIDNFAIEMTGVLRIAEAGEYTFWLWADDVIELYLDGKNLGRNNSQVKIELTVGDHPMQIHYKENHGPASFKLKWKPPGKQNEETIPAGQFLYLPQPE